MTSPAYDQFDDWFVIDQTQSAPERRIDWVKGVSYDVDSMTYFRVLIRAIFNFPDPGGSDLKNFAIDEFNHCIKIGRFRVQAYMTGPRLVYESLTPEPDALRRLKELAQPGPNQVCTGPDKSFPSDDEPTEPDAKKLDEVIAEPPELDLGPFQKVQTALCYICGRQQGEVNKNGVAICPPCKIIIKDEHS